MKNGDIPPERVCYEFRVLVFMHSCLWLGTFPCVVPFFLQCSKILFPGETERVRFTSLL